VDPDPGSSSRDKKIMREKSNFSKLFLISKRIEIVHSSTDSHFDFKL
jgi:hypothetical protein